MTSEEESTVQCVGCESYAPTSYTRLQVCQDCIRETVDELRRYRPANAVWYTRKSNGDWKASAEYSEDAVLVREAAIHAVHGRASQRHNSEQTRA